MTPEQIIHLGKMIRPYAMDRMAKLKSEKRHVAYYTTAETAYKVLLSRQVWMRNAIVMNDYSEIEYGHSRIKAAFEAGLVQQFQNAASAVYGSLGDEI